MLHIVNKCVTSLIWKPCIYTLSTQSLMLLTPEHVNKHFNKDIQKAVQYAKNFQQKFNLSTNQIQKLFKQHPLSIKPETQQNILYKRLLLKIQSFKNTYGDKYQILKTSTCQYDRFNILQQQDLDNFVSTVEQYNISKEQLQKIIRITPNCVNRYFKKIIDEKYYALYEYCHFNRSKFVEIIVQSPFLIMSSSKKFRQSVKFFMQMKDNVSYEEMIVLMKNHGQVFLLGRFILNKIYQNYKVLQFTSAQFWDLYLTHPLLFFNNDPEEIWPKKYKIFKYFDFDMKMLQILFKKYPMALLWSVNSLQAKLFFMTQRLGLKINDQTIGLLKYKFNSILRPRGQILVKLKQHTNLQKMFGYMEMPEQQFINSFEKLTKSKFQQEKNKFPITNQYDYRKRVALRQSHRQRLFIKSIKQYKQGQDFQSVQKLLKQRRQELVAKQHNYQIEGYQAPKKKKQAN